MGAHGVDLGPQRLRQRCKLGLALLRFLAVHKIVVELGISLVDIQVLGQRERVGCELANACFPLRRLRSRFSGGPLLQGQGRVPLMHHEANGRDGGTPARPRLPPTAGAPVFAVGSEAVAILHAARWGNAQHGAANLLAGYLEFKMF